MQTPQKILSLALAAVLSLSVFAGCSSNEDSSSSSNSPSSQTQQATVRLAALKGPTTMGLVKLLEDNEAGSSANQYEFTLAATADEITAAIGKGELDAAAVPCNLASVLYNKTEGKIAVGAVNTLGVLYIVETGDTIQSVADLKGKTIYTTGKGTTPEYSLNYVLTQNGIDPASDVTIEFKSEAAEVAAALAEGTAQIAMLPEPFATTAMAKNENLRVALNLSEEWDKVSSDGSGMVTGVLIFSRDFLEQNPQAASQFLEEYKASVAYVNENTEDAAALVEKFGVAPAAVAQKALPNCSITFLEGDAMKERVGGYLSVLFQQNPQSVGGNLPDDAFYFAR